MLQRVPYGPGLRNVLPWLLTTGFLVYGIADEALDAVRDDHNGPPPARSDASDKLRINWASTDEVAPGSAVILQLSGLDARPHAPPVAASLDHRTARVLHVQGDQMVVQMPPTATLGPAKLRVHQGERKSKPFLIEVEAIERKKILRNLCGGLGLFTMGLRTISRALRASAGQRLREYLATLTQGSWRAALLGALLGGITQSMTSAIGVAFGLVEARLLTGAALARVLVGAQLGTVVAAVLLPLSAAREGLWVIALGMLWILLASTRRNRAAGKIMLGLGLLFLGLRYLQTGLRPLIDDPALLPHVAALHATSLLGAISCVVVGAVLAAIVQGPGPLFALILGMAQTSGLLDLPTTLAVLAGAPLGAVLATWGLSFMAPEQRRSGAVVQHLSTALAMTCVMIGAVPLWVHVASQLVGSNPYAVAYGQRLLLPQFGAHLSIAFSSAQLFASAVALSLIPLLARGQRWLGTRYAKTNVQAQPAPASLATPLRDCQRALAALHEVVHSADRGPTVRFEVAVSEAQAELEWLVQHGDGQAHQAAQRAAALAASQLLASLEQTLRSAERAIERGFELSPAGLQSIDTAHALVSEGLSSAVDAAARGVPPLLEAAQAREIRLNALEAEVRRQTLSETGQLLPYRLWVGQMVAAYESAGNHVYRLIQALAAEPDEDLD